jgi:prolyl 4-hydroxylase
MVTAMIAPSHPIDGGLPETIDTLVATGRIGEAYRLLVAQADASNPFALFILGIWRLAGQFVRRDLAASRDLFRRASEAGHPEAAKIYRAFVGSGVGGPADWPTALRLLERAAPVDSAARTQLSLIDRMQLSSSGDPREPPPPGEQLSDRPLVHCVRKLFSRAECDFLIAEAQRWLAPSVIVDPQTGRQVQNPIRTSEGMAFPFTEENPAIHALNRRIAAATGTGVAQGEPLQVLRYRPGQEFKPHSDALTGDDNQRVLTVLIYLNRGYAGGETRFVRTGLTFRGEVGDALIFRNVDQDGRAEPLAQHAGLPVAQGEKYISTRWIRARGFSIPPPRPVLDL